MKKCFLTIVVIIAVLPLLCAQSNNYVKLYLGQSYYQGDLAPMSMPLSFSPGQFNMGIGYSRDVNKWLNVGVDLHKGRLAGSDLDSQLESRRQRNLSFYTDTYEYSIVSEISITQLLRDSSFFGIDFFYKTGVSLLNIDPKTQMNDEIYMLREYNTEGQGLPGNPDPYGRNHIVVPFGLGLKFNVTPDILIGIEAISRFTFTDYIDDVSSNYPDLNQLENAYGKDAVRLAYRSSPITPEEYGLVSGTPRGDVDDNDWYTYLSVSIQYVWK